MELVLEVDVVTRVVNRVILPYVPPAFILRVLHAHWCLSDLVPTEDFNPARHLEQAVGVLHLVVGSQEVSVEGLQEVQVAQGLQHATSVEDPIITRVIARPKQ